MAIIIFIAFESVRHNDFIKYYDDNTYVTENSHVLHGLTRESITWAFGASHASNWHPVTWLSHMLDCELFGVDASRHHLINLLFHIANTLLLFYILKRMTGAVWQSLFVSALFALHPLHVESVAWIAERKDVLSGFFWLLTIAAHVRYTARPNIARYIAVVFILCLGLMSKPMVVTLPFVLLLLDHWPLGRFHSAGTGRKLSTKRLICEKIPLFFLVALASVATYMVQQSAGAMAGGVKGDISLYARMTNALVSYAGYLAKLVYPARLAVLYPHMEGNIPIWQLITSFAVLLLISAGVIYTVRRRPYLMTGWLWYLGTLVPVIGLVQVGAQSMADRYTYLPSIGIFIMVVWYSAELLAKWRFRKLFFGTTAGVIFVILIICTRTQVRYWRDNLTLFSHALEVTGVNPYMHNNLAQALCDRGRFSEAAYHFEQTLRTKPNYASPHIGLGAISLKDGNLDQAHKHLEKALQLAPKSIEALNNLGCLLVQRGDPDQAVEYFNKALEIKPDGFKIRINLGDIFFRQGNFAKAAEHYTAAVWLKPDLPVVHNNLGTIFSQQGDNARAIHHYNQALRFKPDWANPLNALAWIFATCKESEFRNPEQAVRFAERACQLTDYKKPLFLDTLAAAYAAAGTFPAAIATAEKAITQAQLSKQADLVEDIRRRLHLYKSSQPYRQP